MSCTPWRNPLRLVVITYEEESNESLKSAIKIRNTARLSCKLTTITTMMSGRQVATETTQKHEVTVYLLCPMNYEIKNI